MSNGTGLIVEDGSIVPYANTYVDISDVRHYAEMRGIVLPEEDEKIKPFIINAMDYVETFRSRFQGQRVVNYQSLQFPRTGVYVDNNLVPFDVIPQTLKNAISQLVCDINETGPIASTPTSFAVKRRKIEGLELEYAVGKDAQSAPAKMYTKAMAFLSPLFTFRGGNMLIR